MRPFRYLVHTTTEEVFPYFRLDCHEYDVAHLVSHKHYIICSNCYSQSKCNLEKLVFKHLFFLIYHVSNNE